MDRFPSSTAAIALLGITTATLALLYIRPRTRNNFDVHPYPPGPKATAMPTCDPWIQYQGWGHEYGPLVYIQERNLLILNDAETTLDLLERRAAIYSDRLVTPMLKMSGLSDFNIAVQPYSKKWRRNRKQFLQEFRQTAVDRFYPAQYNKIHEFLRVLVDEPDKFMRHCMELSQNVMYAALYGLSVTYEDPLARKAEEAMRMLGQTLLEGAFPSLEKFPWLRFMPSWFPGCGFQSKAAECLKILREMDTIPFEIACSNMKNGSGSSLIAELALKNEGNSSEISAIKAMGTASIMAAADTTYSSISSFLFEMALHPEIQEKAHEEIVRVVGGDRLPTFEDRPFLPYIEAIYREVMRMHPAAPLGAPHMSTEDDFYRGYHIPKGCVVISNIWALNRDQEVYPEPDEFMPERYLNSKEGPFTNVQNIYAFGFGRRVCPGRYMAENTVWLTIASVLATLKLSKARGNDGNEIDIPREFTDQFLRHPKPFKCSIAPRSQHERELIEATASQ